MRLTYLAFLTTVAASAVYNQARPMYKAVQANNHVYARQLRPPRIVDQALPTDVILFEPAEPTEPAAADDEPFSSTTLAPDPVTTPPPDEPFISSCTPLTICVDAITCGVRYGGCYDRNFCTGTTSYPVPTVTCRPRSTPTPTPE